jgi:hypothetical protein
MGKMNRSKWTSTCSLLKTSTSKLYSIRSKAKAARATIGSSTETEQHSIKAKVEESFRQPQKSQSWGKNILTNIVFDPNSLFEASRRRWAVRASDKSLHRHFEKPVKSNRLRLRVGGVRLSLQEYQSRYRADHSDDMMHQG